MTKLYTRNGDHGKTAGKKIATNTYETVTKAHPLIQLFGAIDELVAYLGVICTEDLTEDIRKDFQTIQRLLVDLKNVISDGHHRYNLQEYWDKQTEYLEQFIEWVEFHYTIQPYKRYETMIAAKLQYACAIARRLENEIYVYINKMTIPVYASWLNRLSTYLYTYAHYIDTQTNTIFLN